MSLRLAPEIKEGLRKITDGYKPERITLYLDDPSSVGDPYKLRIAFEGEDAQDLIRDAECEIPRNRIDEDPKEWLSMTRIDFYVQFHCPVTAKYNTLDVD